MTGAVGFALVLAVAAPLALAVAAVLWRRLRPAVAALAPAAALPALAVGLLVPDGERAVLPDLLLGLSFGLDPTARVFLSFSAVLWGLAGLYARTYLAADPQRGRFIGFFLATMAGNLGLILARDVAGFYLFFSLMTLASYGLVIHEETPLARRAGTAYIVLAVAGETCLLLGFMLAAAGAGSLAIADLRAAVAAAPSPERALTLALLLAGFGVKAGMVPLHVWLPLAHPAAPTPGSAVLSGAIIKAGIFGLLSFLPLGAAGLGLWGALIVTLGFLTAYYGVLAGLPQQRPKTVLAYSSLSQMGLILAGLGSVLIDPAARTAALAAVALYATHHGLAKAGLFLGTGVLAATGAGARWRRRLVLAGLLLPALAIAGAPLTSGALAKLVLKDVADTGVQAPVDPVLLLELSAIGTTLLMARFLVLARRTARPADAAAIPPAGLWLPWLATMLAGFVAAWWLFTELRDEPWSYAAAPAQVWSQTWPVLLGALLAGVALLPPARRVLGKVAVPEGDLIALAGPAGRVLTGWATAARCRLPPGAAAGGGTVSGRRWLHPAGLPAIAEERARRWPRAGLALLLLAGALLAAMTVSFP